VTFPSDETGIGLPFPHLTLYVGTGKDGSPPTLPLRLKREAANTATNARQRSR